MSEKKHLIWGDIHLDYEDWRPDLEADYPDFSEDARMRIMHETNSDYLDDERMNLDIQLDREIIVIADLGRWNGRFQGYKMIERGNIKDCLYSDCDYNEWYVDKKGDLRCTAQHHDGTNYYLYRAIKSDVTVEQVERLQNKIYNRRVTRADITRLTERLGDYIGKVYGWQFPRPNRSIREQLEEGMKRSSTQSPNHNYSIETYAR
jgi:hypothetical protein